MKTRNILLVIAAIALIIAVAATTVKNLKGMGHK
jgi:hypothetical protein